MNVRTMAEHGYGYGRWSAPYWFLGMEEGKGATESEDNSKRFAAWSKLQADGLCDCREFHRLIEQEQFHNDLAKLQKTWRPLILLLKTLKNESAEKSDLLAYQKEHWGSANGETCLAEISGLAARSLRSDSDRKSFLNQRIKFLKEMISSYKPRVVVMYGSSYKEHWDKIAGLSLERDNAVRNESTIFVMTPHPVAHGRKNSDWIELGDRIRGLQTIPE